MQVFATLDAEGFGPSFFAYIADDVDWTVTGTDNPISAQYASKETVIGAFMASGGPDVLAEPWAPKVKKIFQDGDTAIAEVSAPGKTKAGTEVKMDAIFVMRFEGEVIKEVRVYLDSALMKRVMEESP